MQSWAVDSTTRRRRFVCFDGSGTIFKCLLLPTLHTWPVLNTFQPHGGHLARIWATFYCTTHGLCWFDGRKRGSTPQKQQQNMVVKKARGAIKAALDPIWNCQRHVNKQISRWFPLLLFINLLSVWALSRVPCECIRVPDIFGHLIPVIKMSDTRGLLSKMTLFPWNNNNNNDVNNSF